MANENCFVSGLSEPFNWSLLALMSSRGASDVNVIVPELVENSKLGALAYDDDNTNIKKRKSFLRFM